MNASPGAAVGKAVFDSATAVEWAERGENVILVRQETTPDDLHGMVVARGRAHQPGRQDLPRRGRRPRHGPHLRVRRRGPRRRRARGRVHACADGDGLEEGDVISIDGTTGEVFGGEVPVMDSLVVRYFEGDDRSTTPLVAAVARLMEHADGARRLRVRANADTPEDASRARRFGAQGIGLCRTEHMFLGERRELVEHLILARRRGRRRRRARRAAAAAARRLHRDPRGDGRAAGDDPADRPAAARVPARTHRAVGEGGGRRRHAVTASKRDARLLDRGQAAARGEPDARACAGSGSAS